MYHDSSRAIKEVTREARGTAGKHVYVCNSQQPPQHTRQHRLDNIWSVCHTYLILKMMFGHTGCVVTLIQEGTMLKLGAAMDYIVPCIKK